MFTDGAVEHQPLSAALVRTILEHPADLPWVIQDIGLLGLRLDDRRVYRLHVWDPDGCVGEPPIHDHPFDFTSTVISGELTNIRYEESASGDDYERDRYMPPHEQDRVTDTVRLTSTSTTLRAGESYGQRAHELHASAQVPGTVTVLCRSHVDVARLTVCRRPGTPWVSGRSRPPSPHELRRITGAALELMR